MRQYHFVYGYMLCDEDYIFMHEQAQCNTLKTTIISCDSGHLALPLILQQCQMFSQNNKYSENPP